MGLLTRMGNEIFRGVWRENPTFRLVLGMCPSLAISTSVINAVGMGLAATFVLLGSNIMVSLVRNVTPSKIRIPVFIIIISTFVTIVDLVLEAFAPDLHKALGIFIPLIVVNCIILARAGGLRFKGTGPLFRRGWPGNGNRLHPRPGDDFRNPRNTWKRNPPGDSHVGPHYNPSLVMIMAPGAFLTLGMMIGLMNYLTRKK